MLDRRRHDSRLSAQRHPEAPIPSGNRIQCRQCNQPGHVAARYPQNPTTSYRNDNRLTATARSSKPDLSKIQCQRCRKTGHYANQCPNGKVNWNIAVAEKCEDGSSVANPEDTLYSYATDDPDYDDDLALDDDPEGREPAESHSENVSLFDNARVWHTKLGPEETDPEIAPITVPLIVEGNLLLAELNQGSTVIVASLNLGLWK